ncbi:hypothetical protein Hypma_007964 [Hypsizygus marmoreus]|uniref:Coenzyme Q-binding protein COQ10 START domain-containing protein n=1 Tax=Hypsizygus marmoreus TaxID=39966 RepID=A0A369JWI7_HYPMA|nr:hypothetical protein Hypma_007964 [Hypsizygus marmoreus]
MLPKSAAVLIWVLGIVSFSFTSAQTINLPTLKPGIFEASARIEIDAPLLDVWNVLLDFPAYSEWNPFVRSQVVADHFRVPTPDQVVEEDRRLIIKVQIPPLQNPVDANSPSNPFHSQVSLENITHIDVGNRRMAWRAIFLPEQLLDSERWQALSTSEEGKTLYEAREIFRGPLSHVVDALFAKGLQDGFDAQAVALKTRTENQ